MTWMIRGWEFVCSAFCQHAYEWHKDAYRSGRFCCWWHFAASINTVVRTASWHGQRSIYVETMYRYVWVSPVWVWLCPVPTLDCTNACLHTWSVNNHMTFLQCPCAHVWKSGGRLPCFHRKVNLDSRYNKIYEIRHILFRYLFLSDKASSFETWLFVD